MFGAFSVIVRGSTHSPAKYRPNHHIAALSPWLLGSRPAVPAFACKA